MLRGVGKQHYSSCNLSSWKCGSESEFSNLGVLKNGCNNSVGVLKWEINPELEV